MGGGPGGGGAGDPCLEVPPGLTNSDEMPYVMLEGLFAAEFCIGDLLGVLLGLRADMGLRADLSGVPPNVTDDLNGELIMAGERSLRRFGLRPPPGVCSVPPGVCTSSPVGRRLARHSAGARSGFAPSFGLRSASGTPGERPRLFSPAAMCVGLGVGCAIGFSSDLIGVQPGGGARLRQLGLSDISPVSFPTPPSTQTLTQRAPRSHPQLPAAATRHPSLHPSTR